MIIQKKSNGLIFIIFGPTGAGKTDLALRIAEHTPAEIINMDVGQFYTPLSIGTAKPDWHASPVAHHLFDIINKPKHLTVIEYRNKLQPILNTIWRNKKLPIVVGGSGFYLKSLFFPPRMTEIDTSSKEYCSPHVDLWKSLQIIDPVRAAQVDKNDIYRIKRALEIWHTTGQLPSAYVPLYKPLANYFLVFATREKYDLYTRINGRVIQMIDNGWVDEVKKLQDTDWVPFIQAKKIIGYDDILRYLAGNQSEQNLLNTIKIIQKRTRHYAKRQHTFWRMLEKKLKGTAFKNTKQAIAIESVNLTLVKLHLYIKQLLERL